MVQQVFDFPLEGGLDLTTPVAKIPPGRVIGAKNYEPNDEGGYRRLKGYERFDGRPSPSAAVYHILNFDNGSGSEIFVGDIVTGGTSGATSEVLAVVLEAGAWGVDAEGFLAVFNLLGTYQDNEDLDVAASTRATMDGIAIERGAQTDALDETYQRAAIEGRRADIGQVPGVDDINGVWLYNGIVYAFREDSGTNSVSAGTISFANPNTIVDSGSGFGIFSPGDRIKITGSAANSGAWTVDTATASVLTVSDASGKTITTESAGPTVTIAEVDQTKMWESSSSGWSQVDLGDYIDFSVGAVTRFVEGEVITGAPSGATGTLVAVGLTSGSFTGGDAAGRLYLSGVSGTFTAADTLSAPSTATADCDSALTEVLLPRGGKYEFQNYNFFGALGTLSMWGVNKVSRGFRYNDTTGFAFVHVTGLTDAQDLPEHLEAHKYHLFFSFGSSVQFSTAGEPMVWSAILGAGEIATGDRVVSLENQPGDILGIFNRNRTYLLYGDDIDNWDLVNYSLERGAIEYSVQDMGWSVYHDDRGIWRLDTTDQYGDLTGASISEIIDPAIQESKNLLVDSIRIKSLNQYRIFYSNNAGFLVRFEPRKMPEFMPFELNHEVKSIVAEEDSDGFERVFFGSTDGYVYEDQKGESFDGEVIDHFIRTAFCHCRTPRQEKRFRKVTVQIQGADDANLMYSPEFSYGEPGQPDARTEEDVAGAVGGIWGVDFWGDFIWDGAVIGEAQAYIDGVGINVSMIIQGSTNYEQQHVLEGMIYNYSLRGLRR